MVAWTMQCDSNVAPIIIRSNTAYKITAYNAYSSVLSADRRDKR